MQTKNVIKEKLIITINIYITNHWGKVFKTLKLMYIYFYLLSRLNAIIY